MHTVVQQSHGEQVCGWINLEEVRIGKSPCVCTSKHCCSLDANRSYLESLTYGYNKARVIVPHMPLSGHPHSVTGSWSSLLIEVRSHILTSVSDKYYRS